MIRINPEKYIEIFQTNPDMDMILSGWEWELRHFLGIPYIVYIKNLIR